jgi:regulator of protease activity HflC (stomatin/prohibitin superfamily)
VDAHTLTFCIYCTFLAGLAWFGFSCWGRIVDARRESLKTNRPVDRFCGLLQVVSWQKGDVYIYMRNEKLREQLGTDGEGGVRFVFPFMGDDLKGPISCRRMQSKYKCDDIKTRAAVPVVLRLSLDWRISDPYRFLFEVEHVRRYSIDKPEGGDDVVVNMNWQESAETRLFTLLRSAARKVISDAGWDMLISNSADPILNPHGGPAAAPASHARNIEKEIMAELGREMAQANLGLQALSVIVEDVGLRPDFQQKLLDVVNAAKDGQVTETQYRALINSLGLQTVQDMEILSRKLNVVCPGFPGPIIVNAAAAPTGAVLPGYTIGAQSAPPALSSSPPTQPVGGRAIKPPPPPRRPRP